MFFDDLWCPPFYVDLVIKFSQRRPDRWRCKKGGLLYIYTQVLGGYHRYYTRPVLTLDAGFTRVAKSVPGGSEMGSKTGFRWGGPGPPRNGRKWPKIVRPVLRSQKTVCRVRNWRKKSGTFKNSKTGFRTVLGPPPIKWDPLGGTTGVKKTGIFREFEKNALLRFLRLKLSKFFCYIYSDKSEVHIKTKYLHRICFLHAKNINPPKMVLVTFVKKRFWKKRILENRYIWCGRCNLFCSATYEKSPETGFFQPSLWIEPPFNLL